MGRQRNNSQMKGKEEASERMLTEKRQLNYQILSSKQWSSGSSLSLLSSQRTTRNYRETNYNELTTNYINMKREIETIKKGEEEMKNVISELKNTVGNCN